MEEKYKVLVVDDDADLVKTAVEVLRCEGIDAAGAAGGVEALAMTPAFAPEVYLIDVCMPQMSGLELLARLDIRDTGREAIMITGHESLADAQDAMELGACGYIVKPFDYTELIARLRLAGASARRKAALRSHASGHAPADGAAERESMREMLAEKERLMNGIFASLGEGIITLDVNGSIVFMNDAAEAVLGVRFDACAGGSLAGVVAGKPFAGIIMDAADGRHESRGRGCIFTIEEAAGRRRHVQVKAADFRDNAGRVIGRIINLIDQTACVENERLREFFLSAVAHELRTPVAVMKNYIGILERKKGKPPDEGEIIGDMNAAAVRLARLVNTIIMLTRLSGGRQGAERSAVDAAALIAGRMRAAAGPAAEKKISLRVDNRIASSVVHTDRALLEAAVDCLLDNAVKFNAENGTVTVTLNRVETAGRHFLALSFADTGEGMPDAYREMLAAGFMQAEDPLTRRHGGAGVGLFLTRRIAEALGGGIDVVSRPGEGCTVTLRVPWEGGGAAG